LTKCPACKKKKLRRKIGAGAAIVFKGSGFYQTDYRSESYKKAASSDKPAEKSSGDSGSGGSSTGGGKNAASETKPKSEKSDK
ncbi:MAG TPA: zinc ribbon domain-containing protein, partial [Pirellulales bacterium]|nr:zinc ribbon domain-containing protein [Pirellulales bacterium]